MVARQPTPQEQVKGLRMVSRAVVAAGLMVGIGMPILFRIMNITVAMTDSGFDLIWLLFVVIMIVDFALARWLARRAAEIERSLPPA